MRSTSIVLTTITVHEASDITSSKITTARVTQSPSAQRLASPNCDSMKTPVIPD